MGNEGTYVEIGQGWPDTGVLLGSPKTLIDERFALSATYANDAYANTVGYIEQLNQLIQSLSLPPTTDIGDIEVPEVLPINYTRRPSVTSLELNTEIPQPNVAVPTFDSIPSIPSFTMPVIGFSPPQWDAINKPILVEIPVPGDAPAVGVPVIPTMPAIRLPDPPTLTSIVIPAAPESILPAFDAIKPTQELILPQPFAYNEPTYQSDMWTELMSKILEDLRNGGTGLNLDVEASIWTRARLRLQEEKIKAMRNMETKLGPSGLDLPSGAFASAILDLEADWARKMLEQGIDISVKQAELAQVNTHFMTEQGIKCETILRQFFNDQNSRILEASKQVALVGIEVFKSSVELHNAKVELYKAEAAVFESRVRAAQQEIELFKSKVEASKVSAEVQALLVDIYQKQIQAVEAQVRMYATQLESAKIQADVNSSAIAAYKTHVDAYIARLGGEKMKLEIYQAEMDGEKNKAEVYRSQVDAYAATVGAEAKKIDAHVAISEAAIRQNVAKIDLYKADLLAYSTQIDSLVKAIEAKVSGFQAEVSAYNAETSAEASYYSVKEAEIKVNIEAADFKLRKAVAEIESVTKSYTSLNQLRVEGTKGLMDVSAQLTAASLTSVHASASYGYNASEATSESWNHSDTLSESHNFDETPL